MIKDRVFGSKAATNSGMSSISQKVRSLLSDSVLFMIFCWLEVRFPLSLVKQVAMAILMMM